MTASEKKKSILTRPIKWPKPLNWIFGFLFSRKMLRIYLFATVCLVTLIIAFYTIENIRAKSAWTKHVKELESLGKSVDYKHYIPPEIPDDENLAKIPMFTAFEYEREPAEKKRYPWDTGVTKWKDKTHGVLPSLSVYHKTIAHYSTLDVDGKEHKHKNTTAHNYGINKAYGNWINGTSFDFPLLQIYYRGTNSVDIDLSQSPHKSILEDPNMIKVWEEKTTSFPFPETPDTPAKDVEYALKKFDSIWLKLMEASNERPDFRFPLEYGELYGCLLPHLSHIKAIHQYGKLRASAELHAGHHKEGTDSICLMLQLVEKLKTEPFLISYLVRIADFHITLHPVWEGTTHHLFDKTDLSKIAAQLSGVTFIPQAKISLGMERAVHVAEIDRVAKYRSYFDRIANSTNYETQSWPWPWSYQSYIYFAPKGWITQNVRTYSEKLTLLENAVDQWSTGNADVYGQFKKSYEAQLNEPITVYNALSRSWEFGHVNILAKALRAEATVHIARTAVALERYYLNQSTYPETLTELVPQYLPQLPIDPIDRKTLRYHRHQSDQFILYSIGANESDDGGEINKNYNEGDWVWRWPINE